MLGIRVLYTCWRTYVLGDYTTVVFDHEHIVAVEPHANTLHITYLSSADGLGILEAFGHDDDQAV